MANRSRHGQRQLPATPEFQLICQAAQQLFSHGQTTQATQLAVEKMAQTLHCPVTLLMRWDETVLRSADETQVFRSFVSPTLVDMGRVAATNEVVDAVGERRLDCAAAAAALARIEARRGISRLRITAMAAVGAAALACMFGAGDWLTLWLIALSAALGAWLRQSVLHHTPNVFVGPFLAALAAGALAGMAGLLDWSVSIWLVVVCPCMMLMPGAHLLNGGIDMARNRIVLGTARIAYALMVILMICSGLLLGLGLLGASLPAMPAIPQRPIWVHMLAAGAAIAAYGSFFGLSWRLLPVPVVIGMAGYALRWELLHAGASIAAASFIASLLIGTLVTPLAQRLRLPFAACAFAAAVSLVPGSYLFEFAAGLAATAHVTGAVDAQLLHNATTALLITLALTAGLMLPRLVLDVITARGQR